MDRGAGALNGSSTSHTTRQPRVVDRVGKLPLGSSGLGPRGQTRRGCMGVPYDPIEPVPLEPSPLVIGSRDIASKIHRLKITSPQKTSPQKDIASKNIASKVIY